MPDLSLTAEVFAASGQVPGYRYSYGVTGPLPLYQ